MKLSTIGSKKGLMTQVVNVDLTSVDGQIFNLKNVKVVPSIPATHPKKAIDLQQFPHLKNVPLPLPIDKAQAELLIGMDNAYLLTPIEVRSGESDAGPFATPTMPWWSLSGPAGDKQDKDAFSHCISMEQPIGKLWTME